MFVWIIMDHTPAKEKCNLLLNIFQTIKLTLYLFRSAVRRLREMKEA